MNRLLICAVLCAGTVLVTGCTRAPSNTESKTSRMPVEQPPSPTPAQAPQVHQPSWVAAVEHGDEHSTLIEINLAGKDVHRSDPVAGAAGRLTYAPGAGTLLYVTGSTLWAHQRASGKTQLLFKDVLTDAYSAYLFSPNGRALAVATEKGLVVVPSEALPAVHQQRQYSWPSDCTFADMIWMPNRASLAVLCYSETPRREYRLFNVDLSSSAWALHPAKSAKVKQLLGWRANDVLVARRTARPGQDEAVLILPSGEIQAFHHPEEDEEPASDVILAYSPAVDRLITTAPSEDQGDPVSLSLIGPAAADVHGWLESFTRATDIAFSPDRRWAVFVNRHGADEHGDVYLAEVGKEQAQLVFRAVKGEIAYSAPAVY